MKPPLLIIGLLLTFFGKTQTGVFTDNRDGQQYKTIVINGKTWFRENLRFQTNQSFCPNFNKDSADCRDGNYYSNSELLSVCPKGWHVATTPEWESYISIQLKNKNINGGIFKYDTSKLLEKNFSINMTGAGLFTDTLLHLLSTGWIEGLKLKKSNNLSLWISDPQTLDEKYHLHIGKDGFVRHSHEHHIIDKPRKVRMFPVRCVCDMQE
jgi:uncharacterized protein (TIGR02145 family)